MLLVADFRGVYDLEEEQLKELAILDTFDTLAPVYHRQLTIEVMRRWFSDIEAIDGEVFYGYNGIVGRARIPGSREEAIRTLDRGSRCEPVQLA